MPEIRHLHKFACTQSVQGSFMFVLSMQTSGMLMQSILFDYLEEPNFTSKCITEKFWHYSECVYIILPCYKIIKLIGLFQPSHTCIYPHWNEQRYFTLYKLVKNVTLNLCPIYNLIIMHDLKRRANWFFCQV